MKVEIWSDVMCPFCYIGKRKFESALKQFAHANQVEIEWKSFQLDPDLVSDASKTVHEYLAERKGWTVDYAKQVGSQVTDMAKAEGLEYNFDKAIVANSLNAHRIAHLAKTHQLGNELEEALFKAYFTEGKNIDDRQTLVDIAVSVGLNAAEVLNVLNSDQFSQEVQVDVLTAQQIGVRGVPFFVFDKKYAVSGAQPTDVFLGALEKTWNELAPDVKADASGSCTVDGDCN